MSNEIKSLSKIKSAWASAKTSFTVSLIYWLLTFLPGLSASLSAFYRRLLGVQTFSDKAYVVIDQLGWILFGMFLAVVIFALFSISFFAIGYLFAFFYNKS